METNELIPKIKYMIKATGIKTTRNFAKAINKDQTLVYLYLQGYYRIPPCLIFKILTTFPDISAEWLLRDKGPMKRKMNEEGDVENMIPRVKELIKAKAIPNTRAFAKTINISEGIVYKYLHENKISGVRFIIAVLTTFPDISAEWLLRGIGPMTLKKNRKIKE